MSARKFCERCGGQIPPDAAFCPYCGLELRGQTPQQITPPIHQGWRLFIAERMDRIRFGVFALTFALFLAGLYLGGQARLSFREASDILMEVESSFEPNATSIAYHNITLALLFFVPALGSAFMTFVSYSTGMVLSAISITRQISVSTIFFRLLLIPFFWLEVISYSLASTQGIMLLLGCLSKNCRREGRNLLIVIGVCILLLVIAAVEEAATIGG